jgi:hypothetical protein
VVLENSASTWLGNRQPDSSAAIIAAGRGESRITFHLVLQLAAFLC